MMVNNEIGVIQDIKKLGEIARSKGVIFHVDAAQAAGKIPIDMANLPVDLMSFSARKVYGPKGIGALYVRRKPRVRLQATMHGGGHEQGLRSGTLATQQIVGMGAAFALAKTIMPQEALRIKALRDSLWNGLKDIPGVILNGDLEQRVPGNLNISISGVEGDSLFLTMRDLAISSASACSSASIQPSYVLSALGLDDALAHSSLRISLGRYTTEADINNTLQILQHGIKRLRDIAI